MPRFSYKAKKGPGQIVDGVIEADVIDNAIRKLMELGLTPLDVALEIKASAKSSKISFSFKKNVPLPTLVVFTRQICDLAEASVPILRALELVQNQTRHPVLKDALAQIHKTVQDGGSFSEGLAQFPAIFPLLYVNMVRAGEMSGQLDLVLARLADLVEKEQDTRGKIISSLAYPLFILVIGIILVFVLITFVIPKLSFIFEDLQQSLPWPTVLLLTISAFFARFWWLILAIGALLFFYIQSRLSTPQGRLWWAAQKLKIPVVGDFVKDMEISRFARTLGTLLESGVVIVEALKSVWAVVDNEVLKQEIESVSEQVANGASLTLALKTCKYFPEAAINVVAVGEETGKLEKGLYKLADAAERQADRTSKTILSLLGPLVLVLIASIVGFAVIAIILPILQMNLIIQ